DQRRQPGHRLAPGPASVGLIEQTGQLALQEGVADLQRVAPDTEASPGLRQLCTEPLQGLLPLRQRDAARPDPGDAQRRLPPALGGGALAVFDTHADPGGGHIACGFGSELDGNARPHREKIEPRPNRTDVSRFAHTRRYPCPYLAMATD